MEDKTNKANENEPVNFQEQTIEQTAEVRKKQKDDDVKKTESRFFWLRNLIDINILLLVIPLFSLFFPLLIVITRYYFDVIGLACCALIIVLTILNRKMLSYRYKDTQITIITIAVCIVYGFIAYSAYISPLSSSEAWYIIPTFTNRGLISVAVAIVAGLVLNSEFNKIQRIYEEKTGRILRMKFSIIKPSAKRKEPRPQSESIVEQEQASQDDTVVRKDIVEEKTKTVDEKKAKKQEAVFSFLKLAVKINYMIVIAAILFVIATTVLNLSGSAFLVIIFYIVLAISYAVVIFLTILSRDFFLYHYNKQGRLVFTIIMCAVYISLAYSTVFFLLVGDFGRSSSTAVGFAYILFLLPAGVVGTIIAGVVFSRILMIIQFSYEEKTGRTLDDKLVVTQFLARDRTLDAYSGLGSEQTQVVSKGEPVINQGPPNEQTIKVVDEHIAHRIEGNFSRLMMVVRLNPIITSVALICFFLTSSILKSGSLSWLFVAGGIIYYLYTIFLIIRNRRFFFFHYSRDYSLAFTILTSVAYAVLTYIIFIALIQHHSDSYAGFGWLMTMLPAGIIGTIALSVFTHKTLTKILLSYSEKTGRFLTK